jgi:hypothetical protein
MDHGIVDPRLILYLRLELGAGITSEEKRRKEQSRKHTISQT